MKFGSKLDIDESVYKRRLLLDKSKNFKLDKRFEFKTKPFEHQVEGLEYAIANPRSGIFYGCGLGKTKLACDLIRYIRRNCLYLCPARLIENTADEMKIHSFDGELTILALKGTTKAKKIDAAKKMIDLQETQNVVAVVGYESLTNYYELMDQFQYDLLICDESHKLRSVKSNVSASVTNISRKATRRVLMTGTPSLGDPIHLFVQMRVVLPWLHDNYFRFRHTFVEFAEYNKKIPVGFKNLHILRRQVDMFSLQKTKEECLDLPERMVISKEIKMSLEQVEMYNEIISGIHASVEYNPTDLLKAAKLHQVCGGTLIESPIDNTVCDNCSSIIKCIEYRITPFSKKCERKDIERPIKYHVIKDNPKLEYLLGLLDSIIIGNGEKVVIWFKFNRELEIIKEALEKEKYKYVEYGAEKHEAVRKFTNDSSCMIFLSQIQRGSGITLTKARYTIYYSMDFDLETYLQSRDRVYRIGTTKSVFEYHLTMKDSVDEKLSKRLQQKQEVNYAMLRQDIKKGMIKKINFRR
ncbi:MAG: DEAD/DEAH box helicase [Candidatus Heimdallarchaeaceae archaeon]